MERQIYSNTDISLPGMMSKEAITLKETPRYEERIVGISLYYSALQSNIKVARLIRCPLIRSVTADDVVILNDDVKQYRIKQVQYPKDVASAVKWI